MKVLVGIYLAVAFFLGLALGFNYRDKPVAQSHTTLRITPGMHYGYGTVTAGPIAPRASEKEQVSLDGNTRVILPTPTIAPRNYGRVPRVQKPRPEFINHNDYGYICGDMWNSGKGAVERDCLAVPVNSKLLANFCKEGTCQ